MAKHVSKDLVKWSVTSSFLVGALYYRTFFWLSWTVGAMFNSLMVKILKRLIAEKRPDSSEAEDAGMPSAHTHVLVYLVMFGAMEAYLQDPEKGLLLGGAGIAATTLVALARVRSGDHTLPQVLGGFVSGSLGFSMWWFGFYQNPPVRDAAEAYFEEGGPVLKLCGAFLIAVVSAGLLTDLGRIISTPMPWKQQKKGKTNGVKDM